jgi:hypothetical protein
MNENCNRCKSNEWEQYKCYVDNKLYCVDCIGHCMICNKYKRKKYFTKCISCKKINGYDTNSEPYKTLKGNNNGWDICKKCFKKTERNNYIFNEKKCWICLSKDSNNHKNNQNDYSTNIKN